MGVLALSPRCARPRARGRRADLLDRVAVDTHLAADRFTGHGGHDAKVVDDQRGVDHRAAKLVVAGQRRALRLAAMDHEEPAEVTAVGIQQRHVHALDPPVGLHAAEHLDELVEDLYGPLLATPHGRSEPDEQSALSHRCSSCR